LDSPSVTGEWPARYTQSLDSFPQQSHTHHSYAFMLPDSPSRSPGPRSAGPDSIMILEIATSSSSTSSNSAFNVQHPGAIDRVRSFGGKLKSHAGD